MSWGTVRAPEFPAGFTWLNVSRPLTMREDLRGRVVVLDFWTYCCINCLHVLPDLHALAYKYRDQPVAIIGVHSNKYPNEAHPANIREALLRYHVDHPVVVDEDHTLWDAYGVRAWPTLVLISPTGHVMATLSGEGHREELDAAISVLLTRGQEEEILATSSLPVRLEERHPRDHALAFPGKVIADRRGGRLFIADTNHHRVLITDWSGEVLGFFGTGQAGQVDGPYEDVRFNQPQGLALVNNALYIADTGNHQLRKANLTSFHVDTVLGNGAIGYDRRGGNAGRAQALNSPWDLAYLDGLLYIAMAGLHQIWAYDPATGVGRAVIGTGREDIADRDARRAALAQTSGLAASNGVLYFADSETSAIRQYNPASERVETLVGEGLFVFGDTDGPIDSALMQHPLGVAAEDNILYVADTYNHKIRRIDLRTEEVRTVVGTGAPGRAMDGQLALYEPGGLSVSGDDLFVADTNNDRIIHYRLDTGAWAEMQPTVFGQPLGEQAA